MNPMQTHFMTIVPRYLDQSADWSLSVIFSFCFLVTLLFSVEASAITNARVILHDGSVIFANIVDYRVDQLTLDTSFSSELKIDATLVRDIEASPDDRSLSSLLLKDGRRVEAAPLIVTGGILALSDGEVIKLTDIDKLNPEPWEMGQGYAWEGLASAAFTVARGNTDSDQLDVAINTQFDSTRDRFTLRASIEQDQASVVLSSDAEASDNVTRSRETSADNWQVVTKYDYYLEDWSNHYLGVNASVEADKFTDIRLRSYLGPYYGRKLFDGAWGKLDSELGFVWVDTDFFDADDTEYLAANWNITGESEILGGDSKIYLTHVGILNVSDDNSLILDTTVGFGFPFFFGLEAAAEFRLDYDGAAAAGKESVDQSYNLRVGYRW
jgi:putative salt-induced outer membrane protein YdiY